MDAKLFWRNSFCRLAQKAGKPRRLLIGSPDLRNYMAFDGLQSSRLPQSHCYISADQVTGNHFLITLRIFISRRAFALITDSHRILDPTPKNLLHVSERRRTDD